MKAEEVEEDDEEEHAFQGAIAESLLLEEAQWEGSGAMLHDSVVMAQRVAQEERPWYEFMPEELEPVQRLPAELYGQIWAWGGTEEAPAPHRSRRWSRRRSQQVCCRRTSGRRQSTSTWTRARLPPARPVVFYFVYIFIM